MVQARTMFAKIWDDHEIARLPGGVSLLHVDRHLIHDLEAGPDLARLADRGVEVRRPDLTYATPDHAISSAPGRTTDTNPQGGHLLREMRRRCAEAGIRLFDIGDPGGLHRATVAPSGVATVAELQGKGFAYIKVG